MKKDYRKKESLMVVVFILGILLLLAGCPNTTNPKPESCPGNCDGCEGYGECNHVDCKCKRAASSLTFTWDGPSKSMSDYPPSNDAPPWSNLIGLSSQNTDVKKVGNTISVNTGKSSIILLTTTVHGYHYGFITTSAVSTDDYDIYITHGFSDYQVYSKNGSEWFKVGSNYYDPLAPPDPTAPPHDFKTLTDAKALFGTFLPINPLEYDEASEVLTLMNQRFSNAQSGSTKFYPIKDLGMPDTYSGVSFKKDLIYGGDPRMGFLIKDENLWVFGESTGDIPTIKFWVAIIERSTGKGWLSSSEKTLSYNMFEKRVDTYALTSLTHAGFTQAHLGSDNHDPFSGPISNYVVYIVVKSTTDLIDTNPLNANLNERPHSNYNVIQVYPKPY